MDRLKESDKGFSLLELVIAIALSAVVLLTAANLLISFGNFSAGLVKSEASLMGTALGAFEEITSKITMANEVAIKPEVVPNFPAYPVGSANGSCIQIRVDTSGTPSVFTDDTVFIYWLSGSDLKRGTTTIANDIDSLSFVRGVTDLNRITINLSTVVESGSDETEEDLTTTAIMRERSAL